MHPGYLEELSAHLDQKAIASEIQYPLEVMGRTPGHAMLADDNNSLAMRDGPAEKNTHECKSLVLLRIVMWSYFIILFLSVLVFYLLF